MKNVTYASSYAISLVETGKNIRSLRIRNGLSVMDVSDFFGGIARNSIYKWERGETLPCLDNLYALAGLFRVSLDGLVVGNREKVDRGDGDQSVELKTITAVTIPLAAVLYYRAICYRERSHVFCKDTCDTLSITYTQRICLPCG